MKEQTIHHMTMAVSGVSPILHDNTHICNGVLVHFYVAKNMM